MTTTDIRLAYRQVELEKRRARNRLHSTLWVAFGLIVMTLACVYAALRG